MAKITVKCSDGATRAFTRLDLDVPEHYAAWEHIHNYAHAYAYGITPGFVIMRGKMIAGFRDYDAGTFFTY